MSDFEVCPVGTLQRLAAVEAERDSMKEILDHIPQVEAELAETSDKLHAVEAERDALRAEVERLTLNGTHSCHAECQRPVCRLTRERDALLEALDKIACFAPGYGEACEIIAKVARAAIAKAQGGGNG